VDLDIEYEYIKKNLALLFVFSIVGVFLPLYMLLLDQETMIYYRLPTLISILVGWMLVLFFLFIDVVKIKEDAFRIKSQ
jgi:hypothetical protein